METHWRILIAVVAVFATASLLSAILPTEPGAAMNIWDAITIICSWLAGKWCLRFLPRKKMDQ